ncbi:MAG: VapC toxin family PIN domain ribonuclease [Leptolyngbya sp.]|nr:MAG: VapC toxin family PIN domain ribonuclease [Leptolyngbya sp.]
MKHQPPSGAKRFVDCRRGDAVVSSITLAELEYGVYVSREATRSQNRQALDALVELIPVAAFDSASAAAYAEVRAASRDRRSDALDNLIASHAINLDLTLVTNNLEDFRSYPNIVLENWVDRQN